MEEQTADLSDYLGAFKRRRLSIFFIAITIFLIGAITAFLLPPTYSSSATILIKEQDIPADLVRSTVTSFASQRIQAISQRVMARSNLLEIIEKYELYTDERKRITTEEIIQQMRDNIGLEMIEANVVDPRSGRAATATIAFRLSFSGEHPGQVQKVANELMSLYLKENLKERSAQASETLAFLDEELARLEQEISRLEEKLTQFKEQHANELPGSSQLSLKMMEKTEEEISEIGNQIRSIEERKIYFEHQLTQLEPYNDENAALSPAARLKALRTEYLRLTARYSQDHPDVTNTKREIEGLEQEVGTVDNSAEALARLDALQSELSTLRKKYSAEHPDVIKLEQQIKTLEASAANTRDDLATAAASHPDNPAYIQLQSQIEAANIESRSLKAKQKRLRDKLTEYEERVAVAPQLEWEYRTLTRELQNTLNRHQQIRAKQMQAQIAQELEKDSKGERFVIVEPPILPEKPVSPNRPAILFLSFVMALGCGIGYAAVAESLDDSVRGSKVVTMTAGAAPLAVIPFMANDTEIKQRKRRTVTRATAAAAAFILAVAMMHYFWKPLDVLWYKALRKADVVINT
ncbi:GumC family protein [Pseudomonadota bacterium]